MGGGEGVRTHVLCPGMRETLGMSSPYSSPPGAEERNCQSKCVCVVLSGQGPNCSWLSASPGVTGL